MANKTTSSCCVSLHNTALINASLRCLSNYSFICERPDGANLESDAVDGLTELVDSLLESSHSHWQIISREIPNLERFFEICEEDNNVLQPLSYKLAHLLSILYFHLHQMSKACEWALLTGSGLSFNLRTPHKDITLAYKRQITTGLVDRYCSSSEIQEHEIKGQFVSDLIYETLGHASEHDADPIKQKSILLLVYGIILRSENMGWMTKLVMEFPQHVIFLLNHHVRKLSTIPRAWKEGSDRLDGPIDQDDVFSVKVLKVLIDAAAVLTDNLTGLQSLPFTNHNFESMKGKYKSVVQPLNEENRSYLSKHKGAQRMEYVKELKQMAEDTASDTTGVDGEQATPEPPAFVEMSPEEKEVDKQEYNKAFQLHMRAVLYIQPLIEVWDALVYLWDVKRLNKMLINLVAGKACWINGVASSEGRVLALQLILDLVVYENPRLVRMLAISQENYPIKLRESNKNILKRIQYCLLGRVSSHLRLECLSRFTRAEMKLLEQLRQTASGSESLVHQGLMLCHGIITAGTTSDVFLRHNVDWYKRAACWAKFTGASTLGLTHRGHTENSKSSGLPRSLTILKNYLPPAPSLNNGDDASTNTSTGGSYSEGGGLYAVGLIHACAPSDVVKKIFLHHLANAPANTEGAQNGPDELGSSRADPVHHGAALSLGLVYAANHDEEVVDALKDALYKDQSVIGEAAALAIGMVGCNSADEELTTTLLDYARDTQHQKIQRSCGLGTAFLYINRNSDADPVIDTMLKDYKAFIRVGGVWTLAAAYAGTGCAKAIKKCLDLSVDDASSDVQRSAIIALGFILCQPRHRNLLISTISLLMDSYNSHIRYGSAMALGIGAASSGDTSIIGLLRPLAEDATSFVRHGALIGLGLVMCTASAGQDKIFGDIRKEFLKVVKSRQEDPMVRFGGLLAIGLANSGGGNVRISMINGTPRGTSSTAIHQLNITGCMGLMLFANYWFWYPLINCITLAMSHVMTCGITYRLQVPQDYCVWDTKAPADFDYPEDTPDQAPKKSKRKPNALINKRMLQRRARGKKPASTAEPVPENTDGEAVAEGDGSVAAKESTDGDKSAVVVEKASEAGAPSTVSPTAAADGDNDMKEASTTEKETQATAADSKKDAEEDKLKSNVMKPDAPGFWVSIPARITADRARGITSGIEMVQKEPPFFSEEAIKCTTRLGKYPVTDSGCVKNTMPHARYIPIIHKRHEGLVVLVDRWSELRLPVLSNVVLAMEAKPKKTIEAPKEASVTVTASATAGSGSAPPTTMAETDKDSSGPASS